MGRTLFGYAACMCAHVCVCVCVVTVLRLADLQSSDVLHYGPRDGEGYKLLD